MDGDSPARAGGLVGAGAGGGRAEREDVLGDDLGGVQVDAHALGDVRHSSPSVGQAGDLDDQVDSRDDLFADGAFYDTDVDDGFRVRFGLRWMLAKRVELNGYLSWVDLDLSDNTSFAANGIFDLTKRFGLNK